MKIGYAQAIKFFTFYYNGYLRLFQVFENIAKEKRGKVTVFFCGAPVMGKELKVYCRKYGFGFRKENF